MRQRFIQNPLDVVDCFAGLSFRHESYSVAEGMMSRPRECVLLAGVVLVYSRCIEGVLRAYYCARFGCRGPCDALLTTAWQELSRSPLFFWTAWSTSWCCGVDLLRFLLVVVILVILVVLSLGSFRSTSNGSSLFFCSLCGMCRKPVSPVLLQWTVLLARHRMRWVQHTALHVRPASQA